MFEFDVDTFYPQYPQKIKNLLKQLCLEGLELYVVGGAVRDFVIFNDFSNDHDIEVHASKKLKEDFDKKEWPAFLEATFEKISSEQSLDYEKLKMNIYRFFVEGFEVEFSSPRIESFKKGQTVFAHSDLKANFEMNLSTDVSWKRRDFTLNAMGLHIDLTSLRSKVVLIDPYNALDDVKNKELCPISEDFVKDPVRYLRSIRFKRKLQFNFSTKLVEYLKKMNLSLLSFHALKYESFKDPRPLHFLFEFFSLTQSYHNQLPSGFDDLYGAILKLAPSELDLGKDDINLLGLLWENSSLEEAEFVSLGQYLGFKKKYLKNHYEFFKAFSELDGLSEEQMKQLSHNLEQNPLLTRVRQVYDLFSQDKFKELMEFERLGSLRSVELKSIKSQVPKDFKGTQRGIEELRIFLKEWGHS